MNDFFEYKWNEPLGDSKEDLLFVRFNFVPESGKILVFAVVQILILENKFVEIIRFDYSQSEAFHVHKFYTKNNDKIYLDGVIDFSLIEMLIGQVRANWRKYRLEFSDK